MRISLVTAAILILFLLGQNSQAQVLTTATLQLSEYTSAKGMKFYSLQLTGDIAYPLAQNLTDMLKTLSTEKQPLLIDFDSKGGSIDEGLKIIAILNSEKQKRPLQTTVENDETCASMCVPIYMVGTIRYAGEVSDFMFHGVTDFAITNVPDPVQTQMMVSMLADEGVSKDWLASLQKLGVFSDPGEYWMSGKDLMDAKTGVATVLIPRQEKFQPIELPFDPEIQPR